MALEAILSKSDGGQEWQENACLVLGLVQGAQVRVCNGSLDGYAFHWIELEHSRQQIER